MHGKAGHAWTRTQTWTPDMDTDADLYIQSKNDLQLILLTTIIPAKWYTLYRLSYLTGEELKNDPTLHSAWKKWIPACTYKCSSVF